MKRNTTQALRAALLAAAVTSTALHAQTPTGSINGVVRDNTGAVIPNAQVTVRNEANGLSVVRTSNSSGEYTAPLLLPGQYSVSVAAPGFKTSSQTNITLDVAQQRGVDITMATGEASEKVEVTTDSAATVDTLTSTTGAVITAKTIDSMPLSSRNPMDLALLAPGVMGRGAEGRNDTTPHISGSRNGSSEQLIDGISNLVANNNIGLSSMAYQAIVDSVQEFAVQTSVPPAEYGRTSGGVVNLVTKYGTNQFHGTGFLFAHDSMFDARQYFNTKGSAMPDQHRYQVGGTVGGPIFHNKSFFFLAFERSNSSNTVTEKDSVPLPAWRAGDFSSLSVPIYDPLTAVSVGGRVTRRGTFASNIIPANRLNPVAVAAMKYYPLPNYGPAGATLNNYLAVGASTDTYYHGDARVDFQLSPNNRFFGRFSKFDDQNLPFNGYGNDAARTGTGPMHQTATSAVLDDTWTIRPTLLAEFRYGLSRSTANRSPFGLGFDITTLGLPASFQAQAATEGSIFPSFDMSDSYSGLGMNGGYVPYSSYGTSHDAAASLIIIKGTHNIKVGANFRKNFVNYFQYAEPSGDFTFNRSWTQYNPNDQKDASGGIPQAGNAFASMLLGLPSGGYQTHDATALTASSYIAGYAQDDWRVTPQLTLNMGIRWEGEIPRTDRYNRLTYWDPTLPSPLQGRVQSSANCPNCGNLMGQMVFVGTPQSKYGRHQAPFQNKNVSPRFGFAFSPTQKWAIRGGFGILFAPSALQAAGSTGGLGADGFNTTTNYQFTTDSEATIYTDLSNPVKAGYNLPTGAANGPGTQLGNSINYSFFDSVRNPYTEQANFDVERQLPLQTVVEVGYVYSHGLFLVDGDPGQPYDQVNPSYLSLGNKLNQNVTNPFYGIITTKGSALSNPTVPLRYLLAPFPQYTSVTSQRKPRAASVYNAVYVRLEKRLSQGFSIIASYTGSKLMDNSSNAVTYLGPVSSTRADQYNPYREWSLSAYDISKNFAAAATYELPFGKGRHFFNQAPMGVNALITGWQANARVSVDSGFPIVLGSVNNVTGLNTLGQRPNMAPGDPNLENRDHSHWFNTALFSQPSAFTIGNAPRVLGNVRSPGNRNADLSAMKNTYFGADQRFNWQIRVEAFNALNHPIWSGPDTNVNSGNFGRITNVGNTARLLQFGTKFFF